MEADARRLPAVLQARTASTRLSRKVLLPVGGAPIVLRTLERIALCRRVDGVIVATTGSSTDDELAELVRRAGYDVFRGSEHDVLDRLYQCAKRFGLEVVARFSGDNPLIDPAVADLVIERYLELEERVDYVSNCHPPSWPDGQEVEIVTSGALARAWTEAREAHEREHGTPYIWDHPERFRLANVAWDRDLWMVERWTLDFPEDYEFVRTVFGELYDGHPSFGVADILALLERHPEIRSINAHRAGHNWYRTAGEKLRTVDQRHIGP